MKTLILSSLLSCAAVHLAAQPGRYTDWWHFGKKASVHFSDSGPVGAQGSQLISAEGCASISDREGNLLFYTNGYRVYNKLNQQMPHGDSINGWQGYAMPTFNMDSLGNTSTNGVLILRKPGSANLYYLINHVFNCGGIPDCTQGVAYNVIDMAADNGLGDVVQKNVMMATGAYSEKFAATRHANGRDWWIIGHKNYVSSEFARWLVTPSGIQGPWFQSIGSTYTMSWEAAGEIIFNKAGTRTGIVNPFGSVEVFHFNRCTGLSLNPLTLSTSVGTQAVGTWFYGCEWAPNAPYFYSAAIDSMYQWDLTDEPNVVKKAVAINPKPYDLSTNDSSYVFSAMQLGPDDKIYFHFHTSSFFAPVADSFLHSLSVIHNPDAFGTACNVEFNAVPHFPNIGWYGLPNLPNYNLGPLVGSGCDTLPPPVAQFTPSSTSVCRGGCVTFQNNSIGVDLLQWSFEGSGTQTSLLNSPTVCFTQPGTHAVTLIVSSSLGDDTLTQYINVTDTMSVNLQQVNDSLVADEGFVSYSWSLNGNAVESTSSAILLQGNGTYEVVVTDANGCSTSASYVVTSVNGLVAHTFNLFPNPTSDLVAIDCNCTIESIAIFDAVGRVVYQGNENVISTKAFSEGLYVVRMMDKNGMVVYRKLVVSR